LNQICWRALSRNEIEEIDVWVFRLQPDPGGLLAVFANHESLGGAVVVDR
jgi:hypothetical protein